ncbi:Mevalonate kinase-like protein [Elsinoe fawcettii]|nr:Mevalonate kinase-like protein [Elsinoe fawcettii]
MTRTVTISNGDRSSASAKSFMVSAPGKVIVFGEHAVVHGKAAMAASISLRSYLHVEPGQASPEPSVTLNFTDIALSHTWPISSLPWEIFASASSNLLNSPLPRTLDQSLVSSLQPCLSPISPDADPKTRKIHAAAASTFLYLFLLLSTPTSPSTTFTLRSTIPIGAGLGSSASISVCLSTALLHLSSSLDLPASAVSPATTLDLINALAFLGESLIHGTPSGVDNTVSTLGKAVVFRRPTPGSAPVIESLRKFPELPLLVVDTKQAKSTAVEVAKVRTIRERHPSVVEPLLDSVDRITGEARRLIAEAEGGFDETGAAGTEGGMGVGPETVERLGELIRLNHGVLIALGVSHPRLEELREVVDASGAGWFKLTGAGGGGCGFVLLRGDVEEVKHHGAEGGEDLKRLRALEKELDGRGFERYETILGGDGVGIRFFEQGQEISLETFLAAKGTEGVESLCGGDSAGWQYWRHT